VQQCLDICMGVGSTGLNSCVSVSWIDHPISQCKVYRMPDGETNYEFLDQGSVLKVGFYEQPVRGAEIDGSDYLQRDQYGEKGKGLCYHRVPIDDLSMGLASLVPPGKSFCLVWQVETQATCEALRSQKGVPQDIANTPLPSSAIIDDNANVIYQGESDYSAYNISRAVRTCFGIESSNNRQISHQYYYGNQWIDYEFLYDVYMKFDTGECNEAGNWTLTEGLGHDMSQMHNGLETKTDKTIVLENLNNWVRWSDVGANSCYQYADKGFLYWQGSETLKSAVCR